MKMGKANRITKERYEKAKAELKSPKDDARVMKKYGFGAVTARTIRSTDNFYEYRQRSTTGRAKRDHLQATLADLQEEPKPTVVNNALSKDVLDDYKLEFEEIHNATIRPLVFAIVVLACMLFVLGGTIILIAGGK